MAMEQPVLCLSDLPVLAPQALSPHLPPAVLLMEMALQVLSLLDLLALVSRPQPSRARPLLLALSVPVLQAASLQARPLVHPTETAL
jgi:hypothetical protein